MHIRYTTIWHIDAPLDQVCNAIYQLQDWPAWWPSVKSVREIHAAELSGVGGLYHFVWRGLLPYRLEFDMRVVKFEPLHLIEGRASGDVVGTGVWTFSVIDEITIARYEWRVSIRNPLIRSLAYLVYPAVRWNHNYVMRQGGISLAQLLNATLLKIEHDCIAE